MSASRDQETLDKAHLLIDTFTAALAKGNRHIHPVTGRVMTTVKEILECLLKHEKILVEPPAPSPPS